RGAKLSTADTMQIRALDAALEKLPAYEGTVYRSITNMGIDDVDAFIAKYAVGELVPAPAYTSTSTNVYDKSFPIQYVIQSHNGRDIRAYNANEQEILFKRDSVFLVQRVDGHTIYLREDN
ncbi:MAG: phage head morphogenesis protein, partial [Clostridiales bacterium]